jgi:hypothetical protein
MPEPTSSPLRDVGVTIPCPVCRRAFAPVGRQRVCSAACRQTAYRRRQQASGPTLVLSPPRSRRDGTIYQCPTCETRYLGTQRCPECGVFCSRVGPGGLCPHCDEPVALADLVAGVGGAGW